jgi:hypothetical protein
MVITVDGAAVRVDGAEPVPYRDISEVNKLIEELHLAVAPELLGAPGCKACPGADMYTYATNAIAYRRVGTSVVVLVNLCTAHIRTEQVWAGIFGWPLYVLPGALSLAGQYLFDLERDEDRGLLEGLLGDHRDVLATLLGEDHEPQVPAAVGVNTGNAGIGADGELSSASGDDGNLSAKTADIPQGRPGAAASRKREAR